MKVAGALLAVLRAGAGAAGLDAGVLGIVPVTAGTVEIDGVDAAGLSPQERLARFGLVTQEFGRYEMTVRAALALGTPEEEIPEEAFWRALAAARADGMVRSLPQGLDTMLGTRFGGVGLSGGQWQRIALARIHLRGAGIRVLDEPTSAIDAEAEQEVFAQLRETAAEHLTIVVSHRAWTLRGMDRIHVLEGGLDRGERHFRGAPELWFPFRGDLRRAAVRAPPASPPGEVEIPGVVLGQSRQRP